MARSRPRSRSVSMRDLVEELRSAPPPDPEPVRPGLFNASGQFFDPAGNLLSTSESSITPAEAGRRVADGALVAFEGCGCGGWGGCAPEWFAPDDVRRLAGTGDPRFVKGSAPTWIDLWSSDVGEVVFLHGSVRWGELGA